MPTPPAYETAELPNGVRLAYIDSWAGTAGRPGAYTTVLALHGGGVNGGTYLQQHPSHEYVEECAR